MHVVGTAGHVDHGKSTLVERLTGIDPDRWAEEKRRGLTIDLGFAWLVLPSGREVGIVDVPGHERFVKNMLAGAGGVSVCLFVVAANEGWMPQSAEHLSIVDVLGIGSGVVALTKSDAVDADLVELARAEVEEHVAGSSLAGARVVPCSAVTGAGIDDLVAELDRVVGATPTPPDLGRARLWVDRVFTIAGSGTVVTGTLAGGALRVRDEIEVVGAGGRTRTARVRAIQTHKREVESAAPGTRVALNLTHLERDDAQRGDAVVRPGTWPPTSVVDAAVRVVPAALAGVDHELTDKGAHLLYAGSAETPVRVRLLGTRALRSGERGFARLYLRDALPLGRGDRFVLRDAGRVLTFGGGEVLDPLPGPARRARARVAVLERLAGAAPDDALTAIVDADGAVPLADALARSGARAPGPGVVVLDDVVVSRARFEQLAHAVRDALARHHAEHPLERGLPRELARAATGLEPGPFDALLDALDDVVSQGALVRLSSHAVALTDEQRRTRDELVARVDDGAFTPPPAAELGADAALLRALVDAGELVAIGDFYLSARRAAEARARVRSAIEDDGPLTVAQIRDLLGTSRKYAVPLCEWLDATGATRRRGDVRALGPRA
ncbi:MAG TPA: selenocysteine-specific translation elongation factor [Actinomycetota bacterium]|nr:selenocysteine-specific translation elongation factor [Actinomycetota bacterium]